MANSRMQLHPDAAPEEQDRHSSAIPDRDISDLSPRAQSCRASGSQSVVFHLRLTRQQDPQRIHSDGRPEGNVEQ